MNLTHHHASISPVRVDWVDLVKGMCILLVVMLHSVEGVEAAAQSLGWMSNITEFAKPFRMPAFFVVAGLFLARTIDQPWSRYADKKIIHFAYFYVLWLTIQYAFKGPVIMLDKGVEVAIGQYIYAFIQPFGTLWFIYLLPIFFSVARLVKSLPAIPVLICAALLEIAPIHTGWLTLDEFAARFVYFYAGYVLAPKIFTFAEWARLNGPLSLGLIMGFAVINGLLVTTPLNFAFLPEVKSHIAGVEGIFRAANFPIVSLLLGVAGTMALIALAANMAGKRFFAPLEWVGSHSIIIYLAFFLPMIIARVLLLKLGIISDVGTMSLLTWCAAVIGPIIFYAIIQKVGIGHFLFTRPDWMRWPMAKSRKVPVE